AAAAVAAVVLLSLQSTVKAQNKVVEDMFDTFQMWPCSRVISVDGSFGCGSEEDRKVGRGGSLLAINSTAELDELLAGLRAGENPRKLERVSVLLRDDNLLDGETLDKIIALHEDGVLEVDNVLVAVRPVTEIGPEDLVSSDPADQWVTNGDGMNFAKVPFTVARLTSVQSSNELLALEAENEVRGYGNAVWQHAARLQFYGGKLTATSEQCLEDLRCDPLGGLSVWGVVGGDPNALNVKDTVLLATGMDSNAFFHDLAFGRDTTASGLVTTLLAASALGSMANPTMLSSLPRQVGVALFQGETWDRVGSRRFVRDIARNGSKCLELQTADEFAGKSCANPLTYSLAWTGLDLGRMSSVIAVDQLANANGEYYVHSQDGVAASQALFDVLGASTASLTVEQADTVSNGMPPTSLDSFREAEAEFGTAWPGTGFVFAGYNASFTETNTFYRSRFDSTTGDAAAEEAVADQLAEAATMLARTAFVQAGGAVVDAVSEISVNVTHARELWACFTLNFACPLVARTVNTSTQVIRDVMRASPVTAGLGPSGGPPTLFSSVYFPFAVENSQISLVEVFVRDYVVKHTNSATQQSVGFGSCSRDVSCVDADPGSLSCGPSSTSLACIDGQCVCSNAFFHDAVSPYVALGSNAFVVDKAALNTTFDRLWTEPKWSVPVLQTYKEPTKEVTTPVLLAAGGTVTVAALAMALRLVPRLQDPKLKLT
ncbi:Nicastrin (DpNCT), partial [Durusdinium trenchii]